MENKDFVSQVYITIDHAPLQRSVMKNLLEVVVDEHTHLPGMFSLRLQDPELKLVDKGPFDLAKPIKIEAEKADGTRVTLIDGEITSLEPIFDEGMIAELVVRGYDITHRLFRDMKSKAYLNKKDSDLASEIARAVNLQIQVDPTSIVYAHIFQHNQSDLVFLMQRARRIGYECFVKEGNLFFRRPPRGKAGIELTWGKDLLSFHPRLNLAEQVDEVVVKGWDISQQKAIIGRAQKGRLSPQTGELHDGTVWAHGFGPGKTVIVDQPVVNQNEAEILAAARIDELSGAFLEAEGEAFRRPDIQVGRLVKLKGLGKRFSGTYLVTSAVHVDNPEGFKTTFRVQGTRTGSLSEALLNEVHPDRWPGVVVAVVTNADDPQKWGRVKVKFPWMTEDAESDWARVIGIGAGPQAGYYVMPAVGDEVLVAFIHADFSQPCVLGGLWNGKHAIPPEASKVAAGEIPLVRTWRSRSGHWIGLFDNEAKKVEVVTAGGHHLTLDDAKHAITLVSKNGITLKLDDNSKKVTLEGMGELEVNASNNMKLIAGGNIDVQAAGMVNIKGTTINLN